MLARFLALSLKTVLIVTISLCFVSFVCEQTDNASLKPRNFQALENHHLRACSPENNEIYCCGIILKPLLYLINKHCLDGLNKFVRGKFTVLKKGREEDLALIRVNPKIAEESGRPIKVKLAESLSSRETVFRINPYNDNPWEVGTVLRISPDFIFVEGFTVEYGFSGSGVYNSSGELIGITCGGYPKGSLEPDRDVTMLVSCPVISKFLEGVD